ncbi:imidazole glycerol phosphate synthase subunit HisH [Synechococcus sp. HK01-R]|uniref:imidazole glycerol phosphate synthase subunit HisH n=1 Tax=Synechococcus sp. HK01-R TaxID=2751171 RepID=UPI001627C0FB|nr:imidazole glycerol phosphate synthase subunit HisH [Synechococcus sp. HK01-R]QNG27877.1 imidazole glycerol phosphate synthase subunit HisH [Synechococcus sp. HK01-R]
MSVVKLVSFPFCNLRSVARYLQVMGHEYSSLVDQADIDISDTVILPGVGTFGEGMKYLSQQGLIQPLRKHAQEGGKIVGICLGMQLLLSESDESPGIEGLSIVPGRCSRLLPKNNFAVPHIGWNNLVYNSKCIDAQLYIDSDQIEVIESTDFYFVHSFVAKTDEKESEMFHFRHPDALQTAGLCKKNVIGFQFHPEKSGPSGYRLLEHFLR